MSDTRKRIEWVDTARGLAFLMVIYSHIEFGTAELMQLLRPVFLSTFFFVSGYLHKTGKPFTAYALQRTRTLMVPFLIYGTLLVLTQHIFTFKDEVAPLGESFLNMLKQDGSGVIWFIPALWVYSLVFHPLERLCHSNRTIAAAALLLIMINWVVKYPLACPVLPYHIDVAGFACGWMAAGLLYRCYEAQIDAKLLRPSSAAMCASAYIVAAIASPWQINFYGTPWMVDWLIACPTGMVAMLWLSKHLDKRTPALVFIGSNSLLYFCLHGKAYAVIEAVATKSGFAPEAWWAVFATGLAEVALTATLLWLPIMIINRWLPFTLGKPSTRHTTGHY